MTKWIPWGLMLAALLPVRAYAQRPVFKMDAYPLARGHVQFMYEQPLSQRTALVVGVGPSWRDGLFHAGFQTRNPFLCLFCALPKPWGEFHSWGWGGSATLQAQTQLPAGLLRSLANAKRSYHIGLHVHGRLHHWTQRFDYYQVRPARSSDRVLSDWPSSRSIVDAGVYVMERRAFRKNMCIEILFGMNVRMRWLEVAKLTKTSIGQTDFINLEPRSEYSVFPSPHVGLRMGYLLPRRVRRLEP